MLAILFVLLFPLTAFATDRYVSPTGTGSTCSSGSPCAPVTAIAAMTSGDTTYLQDGTYQGDNYMLSIQSKDCLVGSRCTIAAVNDGAVTIDGQNARVPLDLNDSKYWTLSGFNAKNSNSDVCKVRGTPGARKNAFHELRRIICWDAVDADNRHAWSVHDLNDVLLEDVAGFGQARKVLAGFEADRLNWRRCWSRWNKYTDAQPKQGADLTYDTYDEVWENCIFEWDQLDASANPYGNANSAGGILSPGSTNANLKVCGCIAYALTGQNNSQPYLFFTPNHSVDAGLTGSTFTHNVAMVQPSSLTIKPFFLNDDIGGGSDTADHLTSITGTGGASSSFTGNLTCTNCLSQATTSGYDLYGNTGAGATIRYQYNNCALTGTELWPFPMASRIASALTAGGYSSHNVDTVVQSLFGTFPSLVGGGGTFTRGGKGMNGRMR